ncbi:hypothetical protein QFC20_000962 [Naganishia adeliensis]|uniref:Uncharacterized protein n=1 Tax=Naganishia adeliensis TaxID=92952 RepID=A0ACC2WWW0_9TREE|nr:hypothetical protein QFC20_000962 [Naganishia adeliensis]
MRLNRLAQRLPQPAPLNLVKLLAILENGGVKSTDQIVFTERAGIFGLIFSETGDTSNHDAPISTRDFDTAYEMLYEQCLIVESAPAINGADLLTAEEEKARDLHWDGTGLEGLDEVLHGFEGRGIVEMTGKAGVGKTLLSLHVVLRHLSLNPSVTCTWIDTRASFSPARAQQVLQALSVSQEDSVLDRLNIVDCFDIEALRSVLREIDTSLAFNAMADRSDDTDLGDDMTFDDGAMVSGRVRIIVIDTLTNILAPILAGSVTQGQAEIHALMEGLQDMVRRYDLLAIITQTPVSSLPTFPLSAFSTTTVKPPLGASFTYLSDISLLIQKSTDVFVMDAYERKMMANTKGVRNGQGATVEDMTNREGQESRMLVEIVKNRTGPSATWVMFHTDGIRLHDVTAA